MRLLLIGLLLTSCSSIRSAAELDPDEIGAACIHVTAQSINPFVNGATRAAILEVNLGDGVAVTAEQIAAIAAGMHCVP
jgi:hypothetical protein